MFTESYEKLTSADQETFRRIINDLLAHTFINASEYRFSDDLRRTNPDYQFLERNYSLVSEYLSYAGFRLVTNSQYGVAYLESDFDGNREHLNKLTTLLIYALRLIFEEGREQLSMADEIFTTTGDLVHKLLALSALKKKPANVKLSASLRRLKHFRLIEKVEGQWEDARTRILIYPSILFVVTNEQISNMHRLIEDSQDEEDLTEEEE